MDKRRILNLIKDQDKWKLEGIFTILDTPNEKGLIYETNSFSYNAGKIKGKLLNERITGELNHPSYDEIKDENATHYINDIYYDSTDKTIKGSIILLDNERGKSVKQMIDDSGLPYVSFRGLGYMDSYYINKFILSELITYDLFIKR